MTSFNFFIFKNLKYEKLKSFDFRQICIKNKCHLHFLFYGFFKRHPFSITPFKKKNKVF